MKLDVDSECAEDQKDESDVWVGDGRHKPLAQRPGGIHHIGSRGMQDLFVPVPARYLTPVQLLKELLLVVGDQFDQMLIERFFFSEGLRLANRLLGKFAVAAAARSHAAAQCR